MIEERLRTELREAAVPDAADAERRAWDLVAAAYAARIEIEAVPVRRRFRRPLAAALALLATLVGVGLVLTPAGAQVTDWIGDAIDPGRDDAKSALTRLPAPGELLVTSATGTWIIHEDGSKRLLGDYEEATWSPNGLYVAVASGRELAAVDTRGATRWSIARGRISDPRWSPNEGHRVAYRSGEGLRVIWGDGANDEALGPAAPVAPAWKPRAGRRNVLAYVDRAGRVRVIDTDTEQLQGVSDPIDAPVQLEWSADGTRLFVAAARSLWALDEGGGVVARERVPRAAAIVAAALRPQRPTSIVTIRRSTDGTAQSEVVASRLQGDQFAERKLFSGVGRFRGLAYSPDGARLLVGWEDADQWLFLPSGGSGQVESVGNIARQFGSRRDGEDGFPQVDGWCCRNG